MQIVNCEDLQRLFDIDFEKGRFFWKDPPKNHPRLKGQEAGAPRSDNYGKRYWVIKIGRKAFKRARLVFLAVHRRFPEPCVDHRNGNSLDDRPDNLREATVTQNAWNHKSRARRIDLPMGVRLVRHSGRYQARISRHGQQLHLGAYDTPDEAHQVYLAKRKELYGEYA